MSEVVTFGEAMVRLMPPAFQRLEQTGELEVKVGGGELNVAVGCARLGLQSAWVSRLTDNPLGRMVRNKAREQGVDTSHVVWTKGDRVGLYFLEQGASPRASNVLYDRAGSAISRIEPGMVDWKAVLDGARLFHVSGITPALSQSAAAATEEALRAAKAAGCLVSYDLNYRSKLWSPQEACDCQSPYLEMVDLLITTEDDAWVVFNETGEAAKIAESLRTRFRLQAVAITLRRIDTVLTGGWTSLIVADRLYEDVTYELEQVDRVGGGDAFSAGCIYGWLTEGTWEAALRWGDAYSALKHTIPGDLNWADRDETEKVIKSQQDALRYKIQR
jgi:2-dehydro-3-deoxygluconokinase